MELRGAVDEFVDFLSFASGAPADPNAEMRPVLVEPTSGGIKSLGRLLFAVHLALKHGMKAMFDPETPDLEAASEVGKVLAPTRGITWCIWSKNL
jgi:hypothetical protein